MKRKEWFARIQSFRLRVGPPFFLRDSRANETRARVKITLREKCDTRRSLHADVLWGFVCHAFISPSVGEKWQTNPNGRLRRGYTRRGDVSPFSRGVIFTRARVSLALLSLRENGGLLVVYQSLRFVTNHSRFALVCEKRSAPWAKSEASENI